jgi:Leucine-rich repeat (LRR) protein
LRSDKFADLQDLDLRGEWVTKDAITTIADSPTYSKLRRLRFDCYAGGTGKAIQALVDSPYVTQLESLVVPGVSDKTCRAIASSPNFSNLENLSISGELSTDGIRDFLSNAGCEGLVSLRFWNNRYHYGRSSPKPKGTPFNIDSTVSKLRNLEIGGGYGSRIIEGILRNFPDLETLRLTENFIDDAGAIELAESDLIKKLHKLYLTNNQITEAGAIALGEARLENKSMKLYLDGNPITQAQATKLRERFGKSFLTRYHFPSRF